LRLIGLYVSDLRVLRRQIRAAHFNVDLKIGEKRIFGSAD